jgi:hypothetical protein
MDCSRTTVEAENGLSKVAQNKEIEVEIKVVGIDLAKNVFELFGVNQAGKAPGMGRFSPYSKST